MEFDKGRMVWIPCQVKSGPFPDERVIRVVSECGESLVFVLTSYLKEPILEGSTFVRAVVTDVQGNMFMARLPGEAVNSNCFKGEIYRVSQSGPVEA